MQGVKWLFFDLGSTLQIKRECPCFQTWDESPDPREMMLVFLSTKSNLGLDSVSVKWYIIINER